VKKAQHQQKQEAKRGGVAAWRRGGVAAKIKMLFIKINDESN
jgi:hypothetical protein